MSSLRRQCCVVGNRDMIIWWWFFFFFFSVSFVSLSLPLYSNCWHNTTRREFLPVKNTHTHTSIASASSHSARRCHQPPRTSPSLSLSFVRGCSSNSHIACEPCYLSLENECLFHRYTPEGNVHIDRCHCTSSRDWRESRNGGVIFHSTDAPIMCRCLAMHRFFSVRCRLAFIPGLESDARYMGKERQGEE